MREPQSEGSDDPFAADTGGARAIRISRSYGQGARQPPSGVGIVCGAREEDLRRAFLIQRLPEGAKSEGRNKLRIGCNWPEPRLRSCQTDDLRIPNNASDVRRRVLQPARSRLPHTTSWMFPPEYPYFSMSVSRRSASGAKQSNVCIPLRFRRTGAFVAPTPSAPGSLLARSC
jgi:hypothetical protein